MVVSAIHGDEEARGGVEKKTPKANPEWRPRFHGGISRIISEALGRASAKWHDQCSFSHTKNQIYYCLARTFTQLPRFIPDNT